MDSVKITAVGATVAGLILIASIALILLNPTGLSASTPSTIKNTPAGELSVQRGRPEAEKPKAIQVTLKVQNRQAPWFYVADDIHNPTIKVPKDTTVELKLVNNGIVAHDFTVTDFQVTAEKTFAKPGETVTVTFTTNSSGKFTYFCSQPGHKDLGMFGTLIVES